MFIGKLGDRVISWRDRRIIVRESIFGGLRRRSHLKGGSHGRANAVEEIGINEIIFLSLTPENCRV